MDSYQKLDKVIEMAEAGTLELDDEERAIEEAYERGELKSIPNVESEIERYQEYARKWRMIQSARNFRGAARHKENPT